MKKFTICIPTYNRAYTLKRALTSLENQSFSDFEVIIVDDGSTDNTEDIISVFNKNTKLKIRYIKKENGGKYTALSIGIKEALGEFFLILDSDDLLLENALGQFEETWKSIPDTEKINYCGVMGRSSDQNGRLIGNLFPKKRFVSSYVDFHFISGRKHGPYGDCCEIIKTSILKKYSFPLYDNLKFIPEAYITDQIGISYKLLCINDVFQTKEYLLDGITKNIQKHEKENAVGYLEYYICLLDKVFIETSEQLPLKSKAVIWWNYWRMVFLIGKNNGPRSKRITVIGKLIYLSMPLMNILFKIKSIKK